MSHIAFGRRTIQIALQKQQRRHRLAALVRQSQPERPVVASKGTPLGPDKISWLLCQARAMLARATDMPRLNQSPFMEDLMQTMKLFDSVGVTRDEVRVLLCIPEVLGLSADPLDETAIRRLPEAMIPLAVLRGILRHEHQHVLWHVNEVATFHDAFFDRYKDVLLA